MSHKVLVEFIFDCDSDDTQAIHEAVKYVLEGGAESYNCYAHTITVKHVESYCEECKNQGCVNCE